MIELYMMKKIHTGLPPCSEEDWEKLCLLFNEGEDTGEVSLDMKDREAWIELKEYSQKLHDELQDLDPEGEQEYITITNE